MDKTSRYLFRNFFSSVRLTGSVCHVIVNTIWRSTHKSDQLFPEGALLGKARRQGFSLVEVTLAIGVVSFVMVSLMALLPVGLNAFQDSMEGTVSAQVAQRLIAEARQADFAGLQAGVQSERYFSVEGIEVSEPSDAVMSARVTVQDNPLMPGSDNPSLNLKVLRLDLVRNPGGALAAPYDQPEVRTFMAYVARTR